MLVDVFIRHLQWPHIVVWFWYSEKKFCCLLMFLSATYIGHIFKFDLGIVTRTFAAC